MTDTFKTHFRRHVAPHHIQLRYNETTTEDPLCFPCVTEGNVCKARFHLSAITLIMSLC